MATRDLIAEAGGGPARQGPAQRGPARPDEAQPDEARPGEARPDRSRINPAGVEDIVGRDTVVVLPAARAPGMTAGVAAGGGRPAPAPDRAPQDQSRPDPASANRQARCWVALHFPALPLMVCDFPEGIPGVVIQENGGRQLVHAACPLAADLGVSPGMPLNAAHVLCRNLVVRLRDPLAEFRWLKRASEALQRFTPMVSLGFWETASMTARGAARGRRIRDRVVTGPDDNADTLLMEVSGSLRLFGGLETLLVGVRKLFADRVGQRPGAHWPAAFLQPLLAVAPTPAAALLLARNGREVVIRHPAELRSGLGGIPVAGADIDARVAADLGRCGLDALRDLWRLPPADLGRRFGSALPDYLGRLTGERPEAAVRREIAPRFRRRMELPADTRDSGMILLAAEKLLGKACGFLGAHGLAAEEVVFDLWHVDRGRGERGRTSLAIAAARAGCRPEHFLPQLAVHLERRLETLGRADGKALRGGSNRSCGTRSGGARSDSTRTSAGVAGNGGGSRLVAMPVAVEAVSIRIDRPLPDSQDSQDLFQRRREDQPDWEGLMDLLTARLGREAVYRLEPVPDHRPERAMRRRRVVGTATEGPAAFRCREWSPGPPRPPRPLWLLAQPRSLARSEMMRVPDNAVGEGERIEAGWWDRGDVRRDYRVMPLRLNRGGRQEVAMGWIYRQRPAAGQVHADRVPSDRVPSDRVPPDRIPPDYADPMERLYLHGLFG